MLKQKFIIKIERNYSVVILKIIFLIFCDIFLNDGDINNMQVTSMFLSGG